MVKRLLEGNIEIAHRRDSGEKAGPLASWGPSI
jgi:hypothetical protein